MKRSQNELLAPVVRPSGWTPERRQKHAAAIRRWRPWQHATGPRTSEGKAKSALNSYKGAVRAELRLLGSLLEELESMEMVKAPNGRG